MAAIPAFKDTVLQAVCDVLGDTASGLSGSEIGRLLAASGIDDPMAGGTKRHRLFAALHTRQSNDRCANQVIAFVSKAMDPVSYVGKADLFESRRFGLNQALAFVGLALGSDGRWRHVSESHTLAEAQERASKLYRDVLARRGHSDILAFCKAELLQDNYFHAVFEATKSIAEKIRTKSGLATDGAQLVDEAFGGQMPLLAFNALRTETERSEQTGLMNLIKGVFGAFRNTIAHAPKVVWPINEQDALDMLSVASLIHRRLDQAVRTRPAA
jgi:uncharacterized protein (TIGR02391 family)